MIFGTTNYRWIPFVLLAAIWLFFTPRSLHHVKHQTSAAQHVVAEGLAASPKESDTFRLSSIAIANTPTPTSASFNAAVNKQVHQTLVVFSYSESEDARENLKYFVQHGLHNAADFIFVLSGQTDADNEIPTEDHITIVRRSITCSDLGGIGETLKKDGLWTSYNYFILLNASSRGPFLPHWSDSCWSDKLLAKITDTVKLVGTTVKCWPQFHIPSMMWATDKTGMKLLLDSTLGRAHSVFGGPEDLVGLSGCYDNLHKAAHAEIGATAMITAGGYEIDVLVKPFHEHTGHEAFCGMGFPHLIDPIQETEHFGFSFHPYEMMFWRTTDGATSKLMQHLSLGADSSRYMSRQKCAI